MALSSQPILVGVDVGGSKTHIRLELARTGEQHDDLILTSTGWAGMTDHLRATTLAEAVAEAVGGRPVAALVAGVHGNDSPEQAAILSAPLNRAYPVVEVINDSHLLVLAHGLEAGTGVTAGTGSSATSISPRSEALTVGGWGWVLGDEGGGAGLVRDAARQVLDAYDRDEDDPLVPALLKALSLTHPHALTHRLGNTEPREWAMVAPVVFTAQAVGSPRAARVIKDHAQAMAAMVALLGKRGGDVSTIVCAGSVFSNQPIFVEAFSAAVAELVPGNRAVALLREPPVIGALNRARERYRLANSSPLETHS